MSQKGSYTVTGSGCEIVLMKTECDSGKCLESIKKDIYTFDQTSSTSNRNADDVELCPVSSRKHGNNSEDNWSQYDCACCDNRKSSEKGECSTSEEEEDLHIPVQIVTCNVNNNDLRSYSNVNDDSRSCSNVNMKSRSGSAKRRNRSNRSNRSCEGSAQSKCLSAHLAPPPSSSSDVCCQRFTDLKTISLIASKYAACEDLQRIIDSRTSSLRNGMGGSVSSCGGCHHREPPCCGRRYDSEETETETESDSPCEEVFIVSVSHETKPPQEKEEEVKEEKEEEKEEVEVRVVEVVEVLKEESEVEEFTEVEEDFDEDTEVEDFTEVEEETEVEEDEEEEEEDTEVEEIELPTAIVVEEDIIEVIKEDEVFTAPVELPEEKEVDMCMYLEMCEADNVPYLTDSFSCYDSSVKCTQMHKIKHIKESALEAPLHKHNKQQGYVSDDSESDEDEMVSLPIWYKKRSSSIRSRDLSDYEEIESIVESTASRSDFEEIENLKMDLDNLKNPHNHNVLMLRKLSTGCDLVERCGKWVEAEGDDVPRFCRHISDSQHECNQHVHIKLDDVSRWKGFSVV